MCIRLRSWAACLTLLVSAACLHPTPQAATQPARSGILPRDTFAPIEGMEAAPLDCHIVLRNEFVERLKNRANLTIGFKILGVGPVHDPKDDGDIHAGGLSDDVALPLVAEIMNAAAEPEAVTDLRNAQASGASTTLIGVWRVWNEHGVHREHIQGETISFTNRESRSNPDHVFEIHPVLRLGDRDVSRSLAPILGYDKPKDAVMRFYDSDRIDCRIEPGPDTTALFLKNEHEHNYIQFTIEFAEEATPFDDAFAVQGWPLGSAQQRLTNGTRRMIFPKDSPPGRALQDLMSAGAITGKSLRVVALTRVDLDVVAWRAQHAAEGPERLTWNLPYELVVVAVNPPE